MRLVKNLLVMLFLFLLICLFFGEQILTNSTVGCSYIRGDNLYPVSPLRTFFVEETLKGNIPLWNPYWCFGLPFLGFLDLGIFYVPNALFYIFSFPNAVLISIIFHMLFGGFFFYLFAKKIKISEFSSIVSATVFMLCGFNMISILMHHDVGHATIALFPLVFLLVYNIVEKPSILLGIGLAALTGLQVSAGSFMYIIVELVGLIPFLIFLILGKYREAKKLKKLFFTFLIVPIFISLGVLLNSITILPFKEFFENSVRKYILSNAYTQMYEFIHFIDVLFFSITPTYETKYAEIPGAISPFNLFYLGIIPLVLYIFSFFSKNRLKYFFSIILPVLSLVFVCGYYLPFFGLIKFIPILKNMRLFLRFYALFIFAISICSGFGLDLLQDKNLLVYERKRKLFTGICFFLNILLIIIYFKAQF